MLSQEAHEHYRRMTPTERLAETLRLIDEATPFLLWGTPEQVRRKFELLQRQNDLRNQRMLTAIARSKNEAKTND